LKNQRKKEKEQEEEEEPHNPPLSIEVSALGIYFIIIPTVV
jgi:hypothetical protein